MTRLRICSVSSELTPLAKTGGLADVVAALARYLHRANHDIRVFLPFYSSIDRKRLRTYPVEFLQDVPMQLGGHRLRYSVATVRLPGAAAPMSYLIDCPALYHRQSIYSSEGDEHLRFALLSRVAIECCQRMGWAPHVFHCHDWHAALIPLYLKSVYHWDRLFAATRTLLTIHNIGYQGIFGASILADLGLATSPMVPQEDLAHGRVNFLKTGALYADAISAVSPTYAREIMTEQYGMGLDGLLRARRDSVLGILNGVDYEEWDPATDRLIPYHYDRRSFSGKEQNKQHLLETLKLRYGKRIPLVSVISRLTWQKGIDLMIDVLPRTLQQRQFCFVALGGGEPRYEQFFAGLQQRFPERVCFYRGYNNELAHLIEAAADIFLMPSLYEPCGLNQMYSLRYGTVPIVRRTGGLADSVDLYDPDSRRGTGIVFDDYNTEALSWALNTAFDLYADRRTWRRIMLNAMARDYSWEHQGGQYLSLYMRLAGL